MNRRFVGALLVAAGLGACALLLVWGALVDGGPGRTSAVRSGQSPVDGAAAPERPGGAFVTAAPYAETPSITLEGSGLNALREEAVFVVYTDMAALAQQVAPILESINRHSADLVAPAFRMHGLVLAAGVEELPEPMREGQWANVDGVPCLVMITGERSLPLRNEFASFMIFALLAHENVDMGIKEECFGGSLTRRSMSCRWVVEGVADHVAYQSARKYHPEALVRFQKNYLVALDRLSPDLVELDLEEKGLWWPRRGDANPNRVQHAYAAAHLAVAELSRQNPRWFKDALVLVRDGSGAATGAAEFARIASPLAGQDVRARVRHVEVQAVRRFADGLLDP